MQIGFFTLPTSQSLAALEAQAEFKGNIKTSNGHKKRKKNPLDAETPKHCYMVACLEVLVTNREVPSNDM